MTAGTRRPRWTLAEIQTLAARERVVLTDAVCADFATRNEALDWVHGLIAELRPEDYAHSVQLRIHAADVYAVPKDGRGWYLKLTVDEDLRGELVLVISCHPLERPLTTRRGMIEP